MTIIIIKIKRPNGEALEASPPANGRPSGGVQGGAAPPRPKLFVVIIMIITIIIIIIIIITIMIIIIIIIDDNYHYQNQATEWRSARSLSAGQRPASKGGCRGGSAPPAQHYLIILLFWSATKPSIIF